MKVCLLLALLGCASAMFHVQDTNSGSPDQYYNPYVRSNVLPEDNSTVEDAHTDDSSNAENVDHPVQNLAEGVPDQTTNNEEKNVEWVPTSGEGETNFMNALGFNVTDVTEWMWKKFGRNLTKDEVTKIQTEMLKKKNFTETVLAFLNTSYHQMLQLPPRSSDPNATSCNPRTRFAFRFLSMLYKLVKPFMGGKGHHDRHHDGPQDGFSGAKWKGWGQNADKGNTKNGGSKGGKFGGWNFGRGKFGGEKNGSFGHDSNEKSSEEGGPHGGKSEEEDGGDKKGGKGGHGPKGGKNGHGGKGRQDKRGGKGSHGMGGGEGGQGRRGGMGGQGNKGGNGGPGMGGGQGGQGWRGGMGGQGNKGGKGGPGMKDGTGLQGGSQTIKKPIAMGSGDDNFAQIDSGENAE